MARLLLLYVGGCSDARSTPEQPRREGRPPWPRCRWLPRPATATQYPLRLILDIHTRPTACTPITPLMSSVPTPLFANASVRSGVVRHIRKPSTYAITSTAPT